MTDRMKCFGVFLPEECQASMNTEDFDILFSLFFLKREPSKTRLTQHDAAFLL